MIKTKTIGTIYLYAVALLSLLFLSIGIGNLINTTLKMFIFPEAEKRDYNICNQYFYPSIELEKIKGLEASSEDQKTKIDNIIKEYENWEKQNTGDNCYKSERQKKLVDALTMILISLPLYMFHWSLIKKEKPLTKN